ncbi:MAG: hypothetical protein JW900_07110 [Anaerolineae bacterium]|nr:hypothetical protein [Anaerolineae bacterium]
MKRSLPFALTVLVLALALVPLGQAGPDLAQTPQVSFLQTTTNDWQSGTLNQVDVRNLDALHTPYDLGTDPRGSVRLASSPDTWTRQSVQEPAVPRGGSGEWDEKHTAEAAVLYDGSSYMMWYSGQDATDQWQIGLATSTDGLTWTKHAANPVLTVGLPGAWDNTEVSFATLLYDGQTYSTWYSGYDGTYRQIGYAWSNDGLVWTRHPTPVLSYGADDAWDNNLVGNASVLFDGTQYHMWYGGWQSPVGHWRIGHATSPDGLAWTKDPANPVFDLGPADSWDDDHVKSPSVLYDGQTFQLWYGGWDDVDYGADSNGRIGWATSGDGTNWTRGPANPVFDPAGGVWDPQWAADPEVILDGDLYHLWYTGGVTWTGLQIGYATALPHYADLGTYTSPLIPTGCGQNEIVRWNALLVDQVLNSQSIVYAVLDEAGQPIAGFDALQSPAARAVFDLSALSFTLQRVYVQATLATDNPARSPVVEDWELLWTCQALPYRLFLPLALRQSP